LLKLLLKICISAVCIAYLLYKFDIAAVTDTLLRANPVLLSAAIVCLLVLAIVQTARWLLIARALQIKDVSPGIALQSILIGMFFNQTLPSSMGGDAVRVWRLRNAQARLSTIVNSVVIERICAVIAMVAISAMSLPVLLSYLAPERLILGLVALDIAIVSVIAALLFLDKLPLPDRLRRHRANDLLARLATDLRGALGTRSGTYACALSLFIHIAVSTIFWILSKAIGAEIQLLLCVAFIPVVMLVTTLPISIAGWGVREGAAVTIFGLVGVPAVQSVAASILFGLAVAVAAIPGGAVWLLTKSSSKSEQR
jgi:uncharacterized protein (TIRG00374 family)